MVELGFEPWVLVHLLQHGTSLANYLTASAFGLRCFLGCVNLVRLSAVLASGHVTAFSEELG